MAQPKALSTPILLHIAQLLNVPLKGMDAVIALLDEGATVPFIARYRKEVTGQSRRSADPRHPGEARIFSRVGGAPRDRSRIDRVAGQAHAGAEGAHRGGAGEERARGPVSARTNRSAAPRLRSRARRVWSRWRSSSGTSSPGARALAEYAATFEGAASAEEALEGARHIVSEWVSENAEFRKAVRGMMVAEGVVVCHAIEGAQDPEGKFKMYAQYSEPAAKIPSHRMLAIRRGAKEGVLAFEIELEREKPLAWLRGQVLRVARRVDSAPRSGRGGLLRPPAESVDPDRSAAGTEGPLRRRGDQGLSREPGKPAALAARWNARRAGDRSRHSHRLQARGGGRHRQVPGKRRDLSVRAAQRHGRRSADDRRLWCARHNVRAIAIGNGTASRETDALVRDFLRQAKLTEIFSVTVSESGASVYSASDIARQEFPDLDLTVRGAISIARRLQDPLSELVKVDPKSIGVGQYQHDVDQRRLKQSLEATVESCVNRVGVDLNTASWALLRYVAGITERTAQKIVEYRNEHGKFRSRVQLTAVPGFGPKTFEQAAGFLRIRGGENPLDITAVHPESYRVVEKIAASLGVTIAELIAKPELIEKVKLEGFKTESVGMYTLGDIREELRKPGRDPREKFVAPKWREDVKEIADLKPGMTLEGVVTNVTRFGAFIDIGVHQDGLVHVSELANRFVKDASEVVKVGQIVKVQVLNADPKAKRIALSMKALAAPPERKPKPAPKPEIQQPSMEDKLAALSSKFKVR